MTAFIIWTIVITLMAVGLTIAANTIKKDWTKGQKMKRQEEQRKEHERLISNQRKALEAKRNDTSKTMFLWDLAWYSFGGDELPDYARTNRGYSKSRPNLPTRPARMQHYNAIIGKHSNRTIREDVHEIISHNETRQEFLANLDHRLRHIEAMPKRKETP